MFQLKPFGVPGPERDGVPLTGRGSQRHQLALRALLALAPGRRLSRDKLIAWLWPESDEDRGRNLLKERRVPARSRRPRCPGRALRLPGRAPPATAGAVGVAVPLAQPARSTTARTAFMVARFDRLALGSPRMHTLRLSTTTSMGSSRSWTPGRVVRARHNPTVLTAIE
jgi:hypothetical protein